MKIKIIVITIQAIWLLSIAPLAAEPGPAFPPCLMHPVVRSIVLPESGFNWLPDGEFRGKCDAVPLDGWIERTIGTRSLYVHLEGPAGSGRFWKVIVGISGKHQSAPKGGICISTSTVGWRTLRRYSKGALPWLIDINKDGSAEFILWDSFPLHDESTFSEYALVAWVYRIGPPDKLVIDWDLSRNFARSLAFEHRLLLNTTNEFLEKNRAKAADELERFASGRCRIMSVEHR